MDQLSFLTILDQPRRKPPTLQEQLKKNKWGTIEDIYMGDMLSVRRIAELTGESYYAIRKHLKAQMYLRDRSTCQEGKMNHQWKGDKVGYGGLHSRIRRSLQPMEFCWHCEKIGKVDMANKSGNYLDDEDDWMQLCRQCHAKYDAKMRRERKNAKSHTN